MRYVAYTERKRVAGDLKPIYRAVNAEAAEAALQDFDEKWGEKYPMIAESWRARWENITPFLAFPADLRKAVYTTNSIEVANRQIRKAIKTRGHFPDEQAATKLIYLAIQRAEGKWQQAFNWTAALRGLKIHSETDYPTKPNPAHTQNNGHPPRWRREAPRSPLSDGGEHSRLTRRAAAWRAQPGDQLAVRPRGADRTSRAGDEHASCPAARPDAPARDPAAPHAPVSE